MEAELNFGGGIELWRQNYTSTLKNLPDTNVSSLI